jgi:hypothetical protein
MTDTKNQRIQDAIQALKSNDRARARQLILAEVKQNPSNLTAWLWALEVAANDKEKRTILTKILSLDPNHQGALRYLRKLDQDQAAPEAAAPAQSSLENLEKKQGRAGEGSRAGGVLRFFLGWIATLPVSCGFIFLFAIIVAAAFIYFRVNTSFFGLAGTDFDELVISNSYETISAEDMYWEVQFEGIGESKYIGTVRYAAPIRIDEFRILTHDILVTTADFSNPDLVDTNVIDHKFFWKSSGTDTPTGSINLIHAIPANKALYQEMLKIQSWDIVKITGREIYTVKSYTSDGTFLGTWLDNGCNTLLVESVTILKPPDQQ